MVCASSNTNSFDPGDPVIRFELPRSKRRNYEFQAPEYLRNIIRIITETGLRVYKELMPMKKEQVDLENAVAWIPDSKTPNGIAEVPLTDLASEAFREQIRISGSGPWLSRTTIVRRAIRRV
jgi:integrase